MQCIMYEQSPSVWAWIWTLFLGHNLGLVLFKFSFVIARQPAVSVQYHHRGEECPSRNYGALFELFLFVLDLFYPLCRVQMKCWFLLR